MTTRINPVRIAITGAATRIFAANAFAKFREFRNLDAASAIAWGDNSAITFATAHIMNAGEVMTMDRTPPTGEIWAITGGGSINVSGVEY